MKSSGGGGVVARVDVRWPVVGENGRVTNAPVVDRLRAWAALVVLPTGPLPRPAVRNYVFDAVVALVVGIASVRFAVDSQDVPAPVLIGGLPQPLPVPPPQPDTLFGAVVIAVVAAVALALRRRYPLAV